MLLSPSLNSYSQENLSKESAVKDIDFFFNQAEQIHPDLYFEISKQDLNEHIQLLKNSIKDSISISEFSREMRVLVNKIGDGHTNTNIIFSKVQRDKIKNEKIHLPFKLSINSNRFFVKGTKTERLIEGDEIVSINGIAVKELLTLKKYASVDTDSYREKQLEKHFNYFLFIEYGFTEKINLNILRDGEILNKKVNLLERTENNKKPKYSFNEINDTTDVLQINSFSGLEKKNYKQFLDSVFNRIKDKSTNQLIIDLRNNGGGNSKYGAILLAYINVTKYRCNQKMQIKTSKPEKKYIRKNHIKWYMYPFAFFSKTKRALLFKKNGSLTDLNLQDEKLKTIKHPYKGKVCVLSSNNTYSAAADFAVAFRYAERGLIVGDTIGQPYFGFIDMIPVILPNSHITGGVSFKKYEYIGANEENKKQGIPPDIYIDINSINTEKELYQTIINVIGASSIDTIKKSSN
jgi:C-terminal processing protease CtpA/Prc